MKTTAPRKTLELVSQAKESVVSRLHFTIASDGVMSLLLGFFHWTAFHWYFEFFPSEAHAGFDLVMIQG
jgi:hypothetical protein